jgi:sec-independent protein translocase protein TatA
MNIISVLPLIAALSGGWEIVLIVAVVLILFAAKRLPEIARGLGDAIDNDTHDAGKSFGGIHGKPAAQALTPDNQVAEFYDPAAFRREQAPHLRWKMLLPRWWRGFVRPFVRSLRRFLRI